MNKKVLIGSVISAALVILLFLLALSFARNSFSNISGLSKSAGSMDRQLSESQSMNIPTNPMPSNVPQASGSNQKSKFDMMYFKDYGTNVFIDASVDRYSTFGLDVDTASYTIAKNYIMRGELPPTDAIRPEEFINYFDYGYKNTGDNFAVFSEIAPSPFDNNLHYLKIGIKAKDAGERKPSIITFVIDTSGSMNTENRLGLVKRSMKLLVDNLVEGDRVGIVSYSTSPALVLENTPIENKEKIILAIDGLTASGSTNAEAGLKLGYSQASNAFKENSNNQVILLTDGVANVGNTDSGSILGQLKSYKEKGISIVAVGVGIGNYNDVLLEQIADKGDGKYYYVNDYEQAKKIFSEKVTATLQFVAKDAKLQVEFNPDAVSRYRLIGFENRNIADSSFRNDSVDASEIGTGEDATAIYELELKNSDQSIGKVNIRYQDIDSGQIKEQQSSISKENLYASFDSAPDSFKLGICAARFAQILKLTAPPPSISQVQEIVGGLRSSDESVIGFKEIIYNSKHLIELKKSS